MTIFSPRAAGRALVATVLLLASCFVFAQTATPTLKSNSKLIDIRDGELLLKVAWTVDPTVPVDVYDERRQAPSAGSNQRVRYVEYDFRYRRRYQCGVPVRNAFWGSAQV